MTDLPALNSVASIVAADDGWVVILENRVVLPVTDFLDEDGEDCEPEDAVICVAGRDDYCWMTIRLQPGALDHTVH